MPAAFDNLFSGSKVLLFGSKTLFTQDSSGYRNKVILNYDIWIFI